MLRVARKRHDVSRETFVRLRDVYKRQVQFYAADAERHFVFGAVLVGERHAAFYDAGASAGQTLIEMCIRDRYTMIRQLNTDSVNLVTLEDPVEYNIDGVNQVQINEKTGMTFASGLRAILRQDPDIVAVGEIRDGETAEILSLIHI